MDMTFSQEQMAEIMALFDKIEADLDHLHRMARESIATMDRIIASMQEHRHWLEDNPAQRGFSPPDPPP